MDYISRDQNPQFSQPLSQIITMLAIVAGVVGLGLPQRWAYLPRQPLFECFYSPRIRYRRSYLFLPSIVANLFGPMD